MDWENARFNMVEQQIRPWDVLDQTILDLLFEVKREEFVPESHRALAFVDTELPLPGGEWMLQPKLEARIAQELQLRSSDKVLEIGTGVGYLTALLAKLSRHVTSVEINPQLLALADQHLKAANINNISLVQGDGRLGWLANAPYDVIVLGASLPVLPVEFLKQLAPGGRLFAIIGDAPVMTASLFIADQAGGHRQTKLFETSLKPLQNAVQPERFSF